MPYVILGFLLAKAIKEEQEKTQKEIEGEIIDSLKKICQLCWS